ncbi:hypothetical protein EV648_10359 [Kribbella sp. VKM Ac-2568]|nr:hypothetical protein EV648_10359 [Kribbella sp. VKM Ac-2568]
MFVEPDGTRPYTASDVPDGQLLKESLDDTVLAAFAMQRRYHDVGVLHQRDRLVLPVLPVALGIDHERDDVVPQGGGGNGDPLPAGE